MHLPVLLDETVAGIAARPDGCYVDGTAGGGGHAEKLLQTLPEGSLLCLDRDAEAVERVKERLAPFGTRVAVRQGLYADWRRYCEELGWDAIDGIMLDLGFSSFQMDTPERGFSFRFEGPLDMRMDKTQSLTAATIVNEWSEAELIRIFRDYGEERFAKRIAGAVVAARPFFDTRVFASAVAEAVPAKFRYGEIHPATRIFQALRIAVNDELSTLEAFLDGLPDGIAPGGRVAVISFHSLEDRLVKRRFRDLARGCVCPPSIPVCGCGRTAAMRELTRKPIRPSAGEVENNARARSARLRIAEALAA